MDPLDATLEDMEKQVAEAVQAAGHEECRVEYAAYESDGEDVPVNNLDAVALTGRVRLVADSRYADTKRTYASEILENPTWLQLTVCANAMMLLFDQWDHCFFEGVSALADEQQTEPGVTRYELHMGS